MFVSARLGVRLTRTWKIDRSFDLKNIPPAGRSLSRISLEYEIGVYVGGSKRFYGNTPLTCDTLDSTTSFSLPCFQFPKISRLPQSL